ncbi:MAG: prepilin-type N-terminal cleavage/methylation domain-containing protein [Verrucomicrobiota bacterium]
MQSPSIQNSKNRKGFTLIELLIVISIIAVLAAVAFPVMGAVTNQARRAEALNTCVSIVNAVAAYKNEYNIMPIDGGGGGGESKGFESDSSFIRILLGEDTQMNRREKRFLTVKNAKQDRGGLDQQGNLWDPWGEKYEIEVDADYNGIVDGPSGTEGEIRADAIAWSYGKPLRNGQRARPDKWIKSWE